MKNPLNFWSPSEETTEEVPVKEDEGFFDEVSKEPEKVADPEDTVEEESVLEPGEEIPQVIPEIAEEALVPAPVREAVNHPKHYNCSDPKLEAINIIDAYHMNFTVGNAYKYIVRSKYKENLLEDLQKASWYLTREIDVPAFFKWSVVRKLVSWYNRQKKKTADLPETIDMPVDDCLPEADDIADAFNLDYSLGKAVDCILMYSKDDDKSHLIEARACVQRRIAREQKNQAN